jgi:hypothetical protein
MVKLLTMLIKAAPRAPERAATLPPPGAGAELANSSKKDFIVFLASFSGMILSFLTTHLIQRPSRAPAVLIVIATLSSLAEAKQSPSLPSDISVSFFILLLCDIINNLSECDITRYLYVG